MKKYALYILFTFFLFSCNVFKKATHETQTNSTTEVKQTKKDSTRITSEAQVDLEAFKKTEENNYIRTVDYDTLGNILRIEEEWRNIGQLELSVFKGSRQYLSLSGSTIIDTLSHSFTIISTEQTEHKSDSRPIQKTEWLWVILGIAAVLILIFTIKKAL